MSSTWLDGWLQDSTLQVRILIIKLLPCFLLKCKLTHSWSKQGSIALVNVRRLHETKLMEKKKRTMSCVCARKEKTLRRKEHTVQQTRTPSRESSSDFGCWSCHLPISCSSQRHTIYVANKGGNRREKYIYIKVWINKTSRLWQYTREIGWKSVLLSRFHHHDSMLETLPNKVMQSPYL